MYLILILILGLSITNTIFFIRINSIINDIVPYTNQLKTLINVACKEVQC